jgi:cytosine/adenosine deaminase-related metal-dependent hydrolase
MRPASQQTIGAPILLRPGQEPDDVFFRAVKIHHADGVSECFGRPVGKLVPGAHADIILINYDPPTPMNAANLNGHIHFGFTGGASETVLIGGQTVMNSEKRF